MGSECSSPIACDSCGTVVDLDLRVNAVQTAAQSEDLKRRLAIAGGEPMSATLDDFGAFLKNDVPKWAEVVRHAGIEPK
jgi:tripartite-type tricarboxylate transporter receptor subunit TctC